MNASEENGRLVEDIPTGTAWSRDWLPLTVGGAFCVVWTVVLLSIFVTPQLIVFVALFAVFVALPLVVLDVAVLIFYALRKKTMSPKAKLLTWLPLGLTVAALMFAFSI